MRWTCSTSSSSSVGSRMFFPRRSTPAKRRPCSASRGGSNVLSVATCAGPARSIGETSTGPSSERLNDSISGNSGKPHAPGRRRLSPREARLRRRLTPLGCRILRLAALGRTEYCPARRSLGSFASSAPGTRGTIPFMDPISVAVERGGVIESRHRVHAVKVRDGEVVEAHGDLNLVTFVRSAAKPLQALLLVREYADLADEEIAIACASHGAR